MSQCKSARTKWVPSPKWFKIQELARVSVRVSSLVPSKKSQINFQKKKKILLNFWRENSKLHEADFARANAYWDFFDDFETLWQSVSYPKCQRASMRLYWFCLLFNFLCGEHMWTEEGLRPHFFSLSGFRWGSSSKRKRSLLEIFLSQGTGWKIFFRSKFSPLSPLRRLMSLFQEKNPL